MQRQDENDAFVRFLKTKEESEIDAWIHPINTRVAGAIDCLDCSNCCRSLMITVTEEELVTIANTTQQSVADFKAAHIESGMQGHMIMNAIPCTFLKGTACTVYQERFEGCRSFPYLEQPAVKNRLGFIMQYYGRCPIIYYTMEQLKRDVNFIPAAV